MPTQADALIVVEAMLADLACPVVIDHLGYVPQPDGLAHLAFDTMRRLLDGGTWVKLSGVYFTSQKRFVDSGDVSAFAAALAHYRPERVFWSTD